MGNGKELLLHHVLLSTPFTHGLFNSRLADSSQGEKGGTINNNGLRTVESHNVPSMSMCAQSCDQRTTQLRQERRLDKPKRIPATVIISTIPLKGFRRGDLEGVRLR